MREFAAGRRVQVPRRLQRHRGASTRRKRRGVVAFSSGNHAQAIALPAQLLGVPATIVMPTDAPAMKVAATRGYGAEIVLYDRYTDDREAIGRRIAGERGLALIPPYDHADIIAGQGTAAQELFEEVGPLDLLVVPLGGGGLLSGSALAAGALSPHCEVIGVEPEAGNDGQQSFRPGTSSTSPCRARSPTARGPPSRRAHLPDHPRSGRPTS